MRVAGVAAALLVLASSPPERAASAVPVEACKEVASLVAPVPSLQLTPVTISTESHFCVPPGAAVATFSGKGSMKAFSARTPDESLRDALRTSGWVERLDCSADGPDGTVWAVARDGSVVVVVEGRWDGGDDTEPDAPVGDEYEIIVRCVDLSRPR